MTCALLLGVLTVANLYTWSKLLRTVFFSQRRHLQKSISKLETLKSEGFLQTLRQEVSDNFNSWYWVKYQLYLRNNSITEPLDYLRPSTIWWKTPMRYITAHSMRMLTDNFLQSHIFMELLKEYTLKSYLNKNHPKSKNSEEKVLEIKKQNTNRS